MNSGDRSRDAAFSDAEDAIAERDAAITRAEKAESAARYAYDEEFAVFCGCDYAQCRRNKARKYLQDALGIDPDEEQQHFNKYVRATTPTTEDTT